MAKASAKKRKKKAARRAVALARSKARNKAPVPVGSCPTPYDLSSAAGELLSRLGDAARDLYHSIFGEKYSDGITIKGDKAYRQKVRARLDELKKTKSGKQILNTLDAQGRAGKGVVITSVGPGQNQCKPTGNAKDAYPVTAALNSKTGRVDVTKAGKGTSSEVGFNPDYEPKYTSGPNKGKSCRSPAIGLGHELLHAQHNGEGKNLRKFSDPTDKGVPGGSNHEEAQTIGRGAYKGDKPTDNSLRQETGYKPRTSHGSVCP